MDEPKTSRQDFRLVQSMAFSDDISDVLQSLNFFLEWV